MTVKRTDIAGQRRKLAGPALATLVITGFSANFATALGAEDQPAAEAKQAVSQPAAQTVSQPAAQPAAQTVSQPAAQASSQPVGQTATAPVKAAAKPAIKALMADAQAKFAKGQFKETAAVLEKAVKDNPASADAHLLLGQTYCKLKSFDKARGELRLAIRTGAGGTSAQKANLALMSLPKHLIAPKSGPQTRLIASMLGLGRTRGGESKPTVIDFYAAWCQPCKQLDTVIAKAKATYGEKVNFMAVNVDDPGSQTIMDQYDVSPIPTMVFLTSEGEVISYSVGFSGDTSVNDGIKKILAKVN